MVPRSAAAGAAHLGLAPERCYADFDSIFKAEAKLPADERMEFVAIVTPNDLHLSVAIAAFKHGFQCSPTSPRRRVSPSASSCATRSAASGRLYGLTHPYASYPLVVEAAERVRAGRLGTVRKALAPAGRGWAPRRARICAYLCTALVRASAQARVDMRAPTAYAVS